MIVPVGGFYGDWGNINISLNICTACRWADVLKSEYSVIGALFFIFNLEEVDTVALKLI